jgi:hypothetical protein
MSGRRRRLAALAALLAPWVAAGSTRADDGRVEINQTCAVHTGCGLGDAPGFPVTVGRGSYVLTGPLSVSDPDLDAIEVGASSVAIDLNGFGVTGPVSCINFGTLISCLPAGSGRGIDAESRSDVRVWNGRVSGFASEGVRTGNHATIRRLIVRSNGGSGVRVGTHSLMREIVAWQNAGNGIQALGGSLVERVIASGNGFDGIQLDSGSSVMRSVATNNGDDGVNTGSGCVVHESMASGNEDNEIEAGAANRVSASLAGGNEGSAISVGAGSAVQGVLATADTSGFALELAADASYRESVLRATPPAGSVSGGIDLGANSCNGTGACP